MSSFLILLTFRIPGNAFCKICICLINGYIKAIPLEELIDKYKNICHLFNSSCSNKTFEVSFWLQMYFLYLHLENKADKIISFVQKSTWKKCDSLGTDRHKPCWLKLDTMKSGNKNKYNQFLNIYYELLITIINLINI